MKRNVRRIVAALSAATMLITNAITATADTAERGVQGRSAFEDYVNADYIPAGDYTVDGLENVIYHVRTNGDSASFEKLRTQDASDGTRSIRLIANDKATVGTTLCSELTIEFGEAIEGEAYEVSFDAWRELSDWRDYAALNYEGWDGASRLTGTTKWTVEELGAGKDIGGVGEGTWKRYTATFYTDYAPQVNFAVAGWGILHVDNIVVTNSSGEIVFKDSFEADGPSIGGTVAPDEPEEPGDDETGLGSAFEDYADAEFIPVGDYTVDGLDNVIYSVRTNGSANAFGKLRNTDASDGTRSLRLRADDSAASGTTLCAELTIEFGEAVEGETYEVSFDAHREHSDWRDYAAINYEGWDGASRLTGTTKWTVETLGAGKDIGGIGDKTWSRYTATFTTDYAPQINFAVAGWGELHIDNIVVKNSSGEVVFADSFEKSGPSIGGGSTPDEPTEPEEPEEPAFKHPFENYVDADCIPVGDYTVEGLDNVIYCVRTNGSDSAFDKLRSTDASDGTRSLRLRADDSAESGTTLCAELTIEFGEAIEGETYEVSFDAHREHSDWRDYAALNCEGWDGASRLTGTTKWTVETLGKGKDIGGVGDKTWSRYTATFTTDYAPQLNFAVAGWGELHIDNIVVKNSSGEVVFKDSFEKSGPTIGGGSTPDEPTEPEEPAFKHPFENYADADFVPVEDYVVEGAENVIYHVRTNGSVNSFSKLRTADASDGTRSLRLRADDGATVDTTLCAELAIEFGEAKIGEAYEVSFDAVREVSDWRDYASINYEGWDSASRLDSTSKWTVETLGVGSEIGGVGDKTWKRYTATFVTDLVPQINFAVAGWGLLHIDNIVVKNSNGEVVFADSFEKSGITIGGSTTPEDPELPEDTEDDEVIDGIRLPFPLEDYVDYDIKESNSCAVEGAENIVYSVAFDSEGTPDAKVRTQDASNGKRSMRIRGTGTTSKDKGLGAEFTLKFGNPTKDGKYVISFDLYRELSSSYDYATLNYDGWNGSARLTGTTKWTVKELGAGNRIGGTGTGVWSRYTATLSTTADDPQLNFAVANGGELHIDNIIIKDTEGNLVYAESFESEGPMINAYSYSGFGLYADGEKVESIEGSKTYTAKVSIVNNGITDGIDAQIFAVLRKDGELVDINASDLVTVYNKEDIEISTTITVGDISDGDYEISIYLWDGLGTMKVLSPSKRYSASK